MNFVTPIAEYNGVCLCEVTGEQYDPPDGKHRVWMVVRDSPRLDEELRNLGIPPHPNDLPAPTAPTAARWIALPTQRDAKLLLDRIGEPARVFLSRLELLRRAHYPTAADRRCTINAYRHRVEHWDERAGQFLPQTGDC